MVNFNNILEEQFQVLNEKFSLFKEDARESAIQQIMAKRRLEKSDRGETIRNIAKKKQILTVVEPSELKQGEYPINEFLSVLFQEMEHEDLSTGEPLTFLVPYRLIIKNTNKGVLAALGKREELKDNFLMRFEYSITSTKRQLYSLKVEKQYASNVFNIGFRANPSKHGEVKPRDIKVGRDVHSTTHKPKDATQYDQTQRVTNASFDIPYPNESHSKKLEARNKLQAYLETELKFQHDLEVSIESIIKLTNILWKSLYFINNETGLFNTARMKKI